MTAVTAAWNRLLAFVGRYSMYRLVLIALGLLTVISLILSLFDAVTPSPLALIVTFVVLNVVCVLVDLVGQRLTGRAWRYESSLITAGIHSPTGSSAVRQARAVCSAVSGSPSRAACSSPALSRQRASPE